MATTTRRQFTAHTNQAQHKRELGHMHEGKKALGWSDDDYRFHLAEITGKTSAADLDAQCRAKLLAHMARLGYQPKSSGFKPFGQPEKIKWLWKQIGLAGGLRDPSPAALLAFVARTTSRPISDVKFLPTVDASTVIEALKSMLDRAKLERQKGSHA